MSQIQEWYYKGRANASFGAKVNSPLPTIIAVFTTLVLVAIGGAAFILRDYIYDIMNNPQIQLYANINENGYYLNLPYRYEFHPENYINDETTLKYEEFMDPNNTDYTYSIEGNVDTNVMGDYVLTYSSNNRMSAQEIKLTVHVKDLTAPTIKLKSNFSDSGEYDPIILVRGSHNSDGILGTLDFNADKYLESVTDDVSEVADIKTSNTGQYIDLENGNGIQNFEIIYTAVDKAGNSSVARLPLAVMDKYDAVAESQKERINAMERELNILLGNWERTKEDDPEPITETPTISIEANDMIWPLSSGSDGFVLAAMELIDYNGEESFYPVSGAFVTENITEPGTYEVLWSTTDGLTCTQKITVKDDTPAEEDSTEETTEEESK